ncbi:M23 family metallopeptidase [Streptomyces sp. NEAU-Y11]|uniref:M23 family metallopeptidase n=1 Tax=Streptomyces cucumeris TaxID=2962890 RepID=UPI0020C89D51|nr:M23 family metallopeptidase [Streptomyces sp. NEAU-Y11]MCP9212118.1 M23 family metallopeptidase [Streptomyces sp. NEAU-Y11]
MSPRAIFRRSSLLSGRRARVAVVAAGVSASVALGAGAALAAEAAKSTDTLTVSSAASLGASVKAQAAAVEKAVTAEKAAATKVTAAKAAEDTWVTPVAKYTLGATFGRAGALWTNNHSGQDFVVPTGTSVRAVHDGVVVKAGPNGGGDGPAYGNAIVIKHDDGSYTQYAHLSDIRAWIGETVKTGEEIALSGSTGNSTGPHLHFEGRSTPDYGSAYDTGRYMKDRGIRY